VQHPYPPRGPQYPQYPPQQQYPQRPYQYAQPRQQPIDPRYVGPQWAAPGPRRQLPPKKSGGCLVAFLAVLTVIGVMFGGLILLIVIGAGAADDGDSDEVIDLPENHPKLPTKDPLAIKGDSVTEASWTTGVCGDYSKERDRSVYYATRDDGSAQRMRGKVAVVHLRMQSTSLKWTKNGEQNVNRAGLMSQRYITTQAKRYKVNDLTYDVIPWSIRATYDMPSLAMNANHRLSDEQMKYIRDSSRRAVEMSLGSNLERVADDFKKGGYDQVAFLIYFPVKTDARDFAYSAYRSNADEAEAAFLFAPATITDFGHFAVTVTHEGLHLFGADDLYRLQNLDKSDVHDIMGEYCTGFRQATINDATAYSIGWTDTPPVRPYRFQSR
jgi:hypothetical protein